MKISITIFCLLLIAITVDTHAQSSLDFETGYVITGYNDVAIPGSSGSHFSLTDDLNAKTATAFRLRYNHVLSDKHLVGLLVAPLTVKSDGMIDKDIDFNNITFKNGTPLNATFRFDSYRLIYRYQFHKSENWQFSFGGAIKVRDASIKIEGDGLESDKTNTGIVPLLSFNLTSMPAKRLSFVIDGEALAAPQGRAADVLFAARYDLNQNLSLKSGYRILEGGADNDEVYTFSLFHYLIAGAVFSF